VRYFGGVGLGIPPIYDNRFLKGIHYLVMQQSPYKLRDAISMVRPAHTLKGDSLQFGGEALGKLAEHIEHSARRCVEEHSAPDRLDSEILRLRPLLIETLALFERALTKAPAIPIRRQAAAGFGRKAG
jgi:histidine phosphotransfer protein HptB